MNFIYQQGTATALTMNVYLQSVIMQGVDQENRIRGTGEKETRENLGRHISWRL